MNSGVAATAWGATAAAVVVVGAVVVGAAVVVVDAQSPGFGVNVADPLPPSSWIWVPGPTEVAAATAWLEPPPP